MSYIFNLIVAFSTVYDETNLTFCYENCNRVFLCKVNNNQAYFDNMLPVP